jgi:small subunit ribosomal protein S9
VPLTHESDVDDDSVSNPGIDRFGRAYGTGKKKTSIARVWIKDGSGQFLVNDKRFIDYFQPIQREYALGSFVASNTSGFFDVWCTVKGGGMSGMIKFISS